MIYDSTKLTYDNVIQSMLTFIITSLHFRDTSHNINGILSLMYSFLLIFTVYLLSLEYGINLKVGAHII